MESARKLAEDWVAAWNARDLDAVMSHYSPEVVFESPRVAAAFHATGGQVGSPDGVLRGLGALRQYFAQGISALPGLRLELQQVLEGPPGGWYGVQYTRETGAMVLETLRLAAAAGQAAAGEVAAAGQAEGDESGGSRSGGAGVQGRQLIVEARVFYEQVC
ncbi:hypothetical protein CHLRE_11g478100v5 [Chlamydomonas reinhardtii]|uniref:SnoaL-like domain-containing protein n=1 Tax=Chlamydomonas reinhardtii TaxID=3055 RepID=A8J728_CHLRE|nr:uncharacterized protein CHLRE_11g478100v5 [Chlamydomonas reinhardtii]PNW76831.1 hypothetical protein CHLRE_11g478100v5 [Chlamydomonas reinhardtii]|eukprot:XP_001697365.1 predicted protein [Chlamydomonas reinhardtii]